MQRRIFLASVSVVFILIHVARADEPTGWKASGRNGAVAAGGAQAVEAGVRILRADGNAADAAAATLLAMMITDYGSCASGGECSLLVFDAKMGEVKALAGIGRAPLDPEAIEWYYANGIPAKGGMKAAPVPAEVDLCVTLLRRNGTKSLGEVIEPALELLDAGKESWHAPLAVTFRKLVEAEQQAAGSRDAKLLAARDRFYKGDIADELEAWYIETGSFLRKKDLAAHVTLVEDPVSASYRGCTVYKCGTWTQGPALCQALSLLDGYDLPKMGHLSADHVHTTIEALKLAFADRDEYYGDPKFVDVPMRALLSDEYTRSRRALIDPARASLTRRPGDPLGRKALKEQARLDENERIPARDTTTCVVADRWGNVVAATPSCNLHGNQPGPSGVTQGTRLSSLNTSRGHPNRIEPGKRPRITLTPTIVIRDGRALAAISVAGGDLQDQTTLNVLVNHLDFGMLPEKAVTAGRFSTSHHEDSFNPSPDRKAAFLKPGGATLQTTLPEATHEALARRGHIIGTTAGPIGNPVMLVIDRATGIIHAAGDPAANRHAAAVE
ncbi:MAG: hypothetical protein EXS05_23110 [Planctomycetaceae bacterium]|nr:hypothetical protein [Planctomycetaceae bacterium]